MTTSATALTSIGAIVGIFYGVSKRLPFAATAGLTILFAIGGAALGTAYEAMKD